MLSDTFSRLTGGASTSGAELFWPMQIDSASSVIDTKIRLIRLDNSAFASFMKTNETGLAAFGGISPNQLQSSWNFD